MENKRNPRGAGRKPIEDRVKPVTFYIRNSIIDRVGKESLKELVINFIKNL